MLNRLTITHSKQRKELFETFNPKTTTWLVSDLKSKLILQKRCLVRDQFLPENAILRASELWRKIYFRLHPEISLISQELSIHLISVWLEKSELSWAKTSGAGNKMYEFMTHFSGVLSHPQGHERMGDWYRTNVESFMRWGDWFLEAEKLWTEFSLRKLLPQAWISSVLANENIDEITKNRFWSQNLIVDLSVDLNSYEAEIFLQLSRQLDVKVLTPQLESGSYERLLTPYQVFNFANEVKTKSPQNDSPQIEVRRFATMLSEVKDAVAQTREWVEAGIDPNRIAIVAPNIKSYWRCLDQYFAHEGLPLRGDRTTILSDLPDINLWISELKLRAMEITSEDLEQSLFAKQELIINFDRFKSLYSKIYGDQDLSRSSAIANFIQSRPLTTKKVLSKREFVDAAISLWPESGLIENLEKAVTLIFRDGPEQISLPPREWVSYFSNIARRSDISLEKSNVGVHCLSLDSAEDLDVDVLFFLGLSDSELRASTPLRVDERETFSIQSQAGFLFPSNDSSRLDFKARWLVNSQKSVVLSFPTTDFSGDTLSPSLFWIEKALKLRPASEIEKINTPKTSRWDSLQKLDLDGLQRERGLESDFGELWKQRVKADLGEGKEPALTQSKITHLSASAIEDYLKCPFIFASKRLYHLLDMPDLDLDVDASTRGRLMHKVFEKLLSPQFQPKISDSEIANLIEAARAEIKAEFGDERSWKYLKYRLVDLAKKFIKFEEERRKQFPQTTTALCEGKVSGYLDKSSLEFQKQASSNAIEFKGFIDRVDIDKKGHAVILDYKSSSTDLRQFASWIDKNQLQLGIYSMAVEKGLTELGPQEVVESSFYVSRNFNRNYGFRQIENSEALVDLSKKSKNIISKEQKNEFFKELKEKISTVLAGVEGGEFQPAPSDPDKCSRCQWNQLCRSPHLN